MFWKLILQIIAGILGFWLADKLVPGVKYTGRIMVWPGQEGIGLNDFFNTMVSAGILLGCLNFFVKPVLKTIALPIRIITLNLFTIVIALGLVWIVDIYSPELIIKGIIPLFSTTMLVWAINFILSKIISLK